MPMEKDGEWRLRRKIRRSIAGWARFALAPQGQAPARHHRLLLKELAAVSAGRVDRLMLLLPPGHAKALALDTPIPTPAGWTAMGELKVGDRVFDENGQPCNVTWVSPVWKDRPVYQVRTDCGDEVIADKDHEWLVRLCGKPRMPLPPGSIARLPNRDDPQSRFKIKETWELCHESKKRPMITRAKALELPAADLPIDPYLLGVWLGDGNSAGVRIASSADDQPWLRGELERLGHKTTAGSVPTSFGVLGVRAKFVELGLLHDPRHDTYGQKHIPLIYLRASYEQRLALMQGLMDTDGTIASRGGAGYILHDQPHACAWLSRTGALAGGEGWLVKRPGHAE